MHALSLQDISFAYPDGPPVLQGVDLHVPKGDVVVLEGRSGSGKSSLLHIASGLMQPDEGQVHVMGEPLPAKDADRAALRGHRIGLVFQHLHLLDELTVVENIALPLNFHGVPKPEVLERVRSLVDRFGLRDRARARPTELSGGEQQRVAIARALALRPDVLLVDEPTGHLDKDNALTVIDALRQAAEDGAGVLVVTHDELFASLPHRYRLEDGRLAVQAA